MPAAAVIPAPIAYIKVVAVKTLVVELLLYETWRSYDLFLVSDSIVLILQLLNRYCGIRDVTLNKLECFKQALRLEYSSME